MFCTKQLTHFPQNGHRNKLQFVVIPQCFGTQSLNATVPEEFYITCLESCLIDLDVKGKVGLDTGVRDEKSLKLSVTLNWGATYLLHSNWKVNAEKVTGLQAVLNILVWDNIYTQIVSGPTRGDGLLDIYLLRHESSHISCSPPREKQLIILTGEMLPLETRHSAVIILPQSECF